MIYYIILYYYMMYCDPFMCLHKRKNIQLQSRETNKGIEQFGQQKGGITPPPPSSIFDMIYSRIHPHIPPSSFSRIYTYSTPYLSSGFLESGNVSRELHNAVLSLDKFGLGLSNCLIW